MELGLSRISRLVRDHHKILPWKAVHVAGTNGKGTTSRYLEALLDRSNVSVGLFGSPHLVERHDCIRVACKSVDKRTFLECEEHVKKRNDEASINATSFELLTATAFEVFNRDKIEVAIIECGLGGRLDATNVLSSDEVLCSVITRIGLDHQEILGDTIEEIAAEKAGIIKRSVPVVVDSRNISSIKQLLKNRAEALGSHFLTSKPVVAKDYLISNSYLAIAAYYEVVRRMKRSVDRLKGARAIPPRRVDEMLQEAVKGLEGRFQRVPAFAITKSTKPIILDGAHNEQAATALRFKVDALRDHPTPVTWVIAISSTKNSDAFLKALLDPDDRVILCEFGPVEGMPWVRPQLKEVLFTIASSITKYVSVAPSIRQALRMAADVSPESSDIVVTGSLYLVGNVLRLLQSDNELPTMTHIKPRRNDGVYMKHLQLDGANLVQQRDAQKAVRIEQGLCVYCGGAGHTISNCPRRLSKANREEKSTPFNPGIDSDAQNDDAQEGSPPAAEASPTRTKQPEKAEGLKHFVIDTPKAWQT